MLLLPACLITPTWVHRRRDEGWHCLYLNNKQNFIKSIDITQTFRLSTDQILLPRNCIKLPPKICGTRCFPSPTSFRQIPSVSNVKSTKELEHPGRFVRKGFDPFSLSHRFRCLKIRKDKLAGFMSVSWLRNGPHLNCRKSIFMLLWLLFQGPGISRDFHLILWLVSGKLTVREHGWQRGTPRQLQSLP